jgi:hypothetical protein
MRNPKLGVNNRSTYAMIVRLIMVADVLPLAVEGWSGWAGWSRRRRSINKERRPVGDEPAEEFFGLGD